nr:asparagine synthase (glutamine-hydrolyzing) [uncultured Flavobacterium sp.]
MCGILGHISTKTAVNQKLFGQMLITLEHRGPDDFGVFYSKDNTVALGHTRLSFLDLSPLGKQPLCNVEENIWISFNGEIYNFLELKEELKDKYQFKTQTDTEVLIAAYQTWGINFINKLKGMFAFSLLDERQNKLFLVRDRFGIKPLYYFKNTENLVFASELKAIIASEIPKKEIDFSAFADYFVYRYIPSPKTIWKDIKKLPPANYLEINTLTLDEKLHEYWNLSSKNSIVKEDELIPKINSILINSIKQHIRSDLPIGSFLSGGYDSSAIVSYLKKIKYNPKTFSIGFSKWEKSEHQFASIVAKHLNISNEVVIADNSSLDLVNKMAEVYDEPIADISIVPTFMVSQLARKSVKAVLSGEGADEIFGGYTWQHDFYKLNNPKHFLSKLKIKLKPVDTVSFYAKAMAMGWFDKKELQKMLHPNLHPFIPEDVHWFYRKNFDPKLSPLKSIQYLDIKCFMGELVLTKIDRASMANSLEVRVPFLDHELFETVFSLEENQYYKTEKSKYLLYENIKKDLPDEILERKKQGFVGPDAYYMDLKYYKSELKNSKLVAYKIINQSYIDDLFKEEYNWKLWKILIMEKWFQKWGI